MSIAIPSHTPVSQADCPLLHTTLDIPVVQSTDFIAWLRRLFDELFGTFGEKLSCSQLNASLNSIFVPEEGWDVGPSFEYGGTIQTAYRSQCLGGTTYVISAPAHDLLDDQSLQAQLSGGRSVVQTVKAIVDGYPQGEVKALIPVAQSNRMGFCGVRGHFVLLEVDIKDATLNMAQLHDAKEGLIDYFYDGAGWLTNQLQGNRAFNLGADFVLKTEHRGEQPLFNGNDCGRYVTYYANEIIDKGDLSAASRETAQAFFTHHFIRSNK